MLTISMEQMRVFAEAHIDALRSELIAHVTNYFPSVKARGTGTVEQVADSALMEMASRKLSRRALFQYCNLLCVLGPDFRERSELLSFVQILDNDDIGDWENRVHHLHAAVLADLNRTARNDIARRAFADDR